MTIKIGINDIHRWLFNPDENIKISPQQFEQMYDAILDRTKKQTRTKVVLIDPFFISMDPSPGSQRSVVLKHLPEFLKVVEKMAKKYRARHVRTHRAYQTLLKYYPVDQFCPEPVHPNPCGHLVIAHEWLKKMGW